MPETQITLTGKRHKEFVALKKRIEGETYLNLTNPQVLDYLMVFYKRNSGEE